MTHNHTETQGELKPCPFCGNAPKTLKYNGTTQVTCSSLMFECAGFDVVAPVAMWNRRAELDSLRAPVAVSEVEAAACRFQDAFTNGNASWEETPQHHKDAFMAGARAALTKGSKP